MAENKTFKIPRNLLMIVFNGDMQAVRAMEKLQLSAFELLPQDIAEIIERAAADAMQAAMIANQIRQDVMPYLSPVSVPVLPDMALSPVNVSTTHQDQLQAVNGQYDCNQTLGTV